ncbi:methyl-accepting chemotaxis protein [Sodalis ligni]|uniref:Methyl-accepting chemotaxis sensory transducer with TarH sensor n=1 Tax=Sodalis ligni TaxID=2697027 RepID=A0A4R1NCT5_9GAMM|nr:methyl-accepting chemotaxis protein [Sodalis ligni]TCL04647.1 methyl-accepting chemotaxis sensory transducer with TarH sensor [Sodalis ligni]
MSIIKPVVHWPKILRFRHLSLPGWMTSLRGGFILFTLVFCLLQCASIALLTRLVTQTTTNVTTARMMTERQSLLNKSRIELLTASDNINRAGIYYMQDKQSGSVGSWNALADSADASLKAAQGYYSSYQKLSSGQDDSALQQSFSMVFDGLHEQLKGIRADNIDSFFMVPIQAFQEQFNGLFYQWLQQDNADAEHFNQTMLASLTHNRNISLSISVLLMGLLVLACLVLSFAVVTPLNRALRHLASIATGNIAHALPASRWQSREIHWLNQGIDEMQRGLQHIIQEINEISSLVMHSANDIAQHNQGYSRQNQQQMAAFDAISDKLDSIAQDVDNGARFAGNATRQMSDAEALTRHCGEMVTEVDRKMHEIVAESEKIAGIITMLDGISMQTKLLALNAAIESAHAGLYGRSFSVVAKEIGLLSQKSGSSTREIDHLIHSTHKHIDSGFSRVKALDTFYLDIIKSVRGVSVLLEELQQNANQQSLQVNTIAGEIKRLNDQIHQSHSLTVASAQASDSLISHSQRLRQSVSKFSLTL